MSNLPKVYLSTSPSDTERFGTLLAGTLKAGDVLVLTGDLAAGKTVFVRGIATGLGANPDEVHSPTFTLLHIYRGSVPLYHFDLYRLEEPDEISKLGFDEYFYDSDGVTVVEWGDKFPGSMPASAVRVVLSPGDGPQERLIEICYADETRPKRILRGGQP